MTPVDSGELLGSYRAGTGDSPGSTTSFRQVADRLGVTLIVITTEGEKFSTLDLGLHIGAGGRRKGSPQAPNGIAAPGRSRGGQEVRMIEITTPAGRVDEHLWQYVRGSITWAPTLRTEDVGDVLRGPYRTGSQGEISFTPTQVLREVGIVMMHTSGGGPSSSRSYRAVDLFDRSPPRSPRA